MILFAVVQALFAQEGEKKAAEPAKPAAARPQLLQLPRRQPHQLLPAPVALPDTTMGIQPIQTVMAKSTIKDTPKWPDLPAALPDIGRRLPPPAMNCRQNSVPGSTTCCSQSGSAAGRVRPLRRVFIVDFAITVVMVGCPSYVIGQCTGAAAAGAAAPRQLEQLRAQAAAGFAGSAAFFSPSCANSACTTANNIMAPTRLP